MKKWAIYLFLAVLSFVLLFCSREPASFNLNASGYLNLAKDVEYVGIQNCRSCHPNVYDTYIHTGMGRSFDKATPKKSDASFGAHALVYDEHSNLYYKPFFKDSILFVTEFRLENGDTIHERTEKISYIVGSGQHTNSHIVDINGYIYQAPITFYTQEGKWDLAPGFEDGQNSRFSRLLTTECITCHNHFPEHKEGSINKYTKMPTGIECERCHGPGEIHVEEMLKGNLVDTSQYIDYTIVNPSNLSRDHQMDLCQRCHLQGVAVLKEGKTFFDFKPGMKLSTVMNVFLPRYDNSHEKFIMASQADRLRMSKCYQLSEELSCLSCHHPHHSIESTSRDKYNDACKSCHADNSQAICTAPAAEIEAANNDCASCHMRRSGSIDIPHVNITDHYIARETARLPSEKEEETILEEDKESIARFLGLEILTKEKGTPLEMAQGYIALYDKFVETEEMLDSALYFLQQCSSNSYEELKTRIHYYFARKDYLSLYALRTDLPPKDVKGGWTAYRLGEACYQLQDFASAAVYLEKAVDFLPYHLDFLEKLGIARMKLQQIQKAEEAFELVLLENDRRPIALCNLGYAKALQGRFAEADRLYDQAIALDPDYEQAILNKGAVAIAMGNRNEGIQLLQRVLSINPENQQVKAMLEQLNSYQ
jgi:tetratricopeptide (TPR) repeat protein